MKKLFLLTLLLSFLFGGMAYAQFLPSGNAKQIQGRPISPVAPTESQPLIWDNTLKLWKPGNPKSATSYSVPAGTTPTIDYKNGAIQVINLTGNTTVSWTLPPSGIYSEVTLMVTQHTGAHYNIVWNATKWQAGLVPLITQNDAATDFISCFLDSTGAYCAFGQDFH